LLLAVRSYQAAVEREDISRRTKAGLARKKEEGVQLGRPNRMVLEKPEDFENNLAQIKKMIDEDCKYTVIAKKMKCNTTTLRKFVQKYNLGKTKNDEFTQIPVVDHPQNTTTQPLHTDQVVETSAESSESLPEKMEFVHEPVTIEEKKPKQIRQTKKVNPVKEKQVPPQPQNGYNRYNMAYPPPYYPPYGAPNYHYSLPPPNNNYSYHLPPPNTNYNHPYYPPQAEIQTPLKKR